jgi:hypothetical protein
MPDIELFDKSIDLEQRFQLACEARKKQIFVSIKEQQPQQQSQPQPQQQQQSDKDKNEKDQQQQQQAKREERTEPLPAENTAKNDDILSCRVKVNFSGTPFFFSYPADESLKRERERETERKSKGDLNKETK